jgi:HD-like signal output (HDOD) protein
VIGADHTHIGAMLGEKWQLPAELVRVIREHHDMREEDTPPFPLLDAVVVANQLTKVAEFGHSGNPVIETVPQSVMNTFGPDQNLMTLRESLGDIESEMEKTRIFIKL